jgi:hypothetical protein
MGAALCFLDSSLLFLVMAFIWCLAVLRRGRLAAAG